MDASIAWEKTGFAFCAGKGAADASTTSTSAGSASTASGRTTPKDGDVVSPVGWRVRNTFLDSPTDSLTLLETFQQGRRASSAPPPGSRGEEGTPEEEELAEDEELALELEEEARATEAAAEVDREAAQREVETARLLASLEPRCMAPPPGNFTAGGSAASTAQPRMPAPPRSAPLALSLAELVTSEPPTPGSALHATGECRPCAFFWKAVGCQSGSNCEFCHLCDRDERKRRNKEKKIAMYAAAQAQQQQEQMQQAALDAGTLPPRTLQLAAMGGA